MTDTDRRTFLSRTAGALAAIALEPAAAAVPPPRRAAPLGVGLIGAGRQGRAILGELQKLDGVRVVAVCDAIEGRLGAGLRRAPGAEGHADYRRLLETAGVEAVLIATPTHAHRQIALDAIAARKHVWCEAPLAATADDARAIAAAARGSDRVFQAALLARSNPIYRLAWSFFRSGTLRQLLLLRAQDHEKTSWRIPASDAALERAMNWRLDASVSTGLPGELATHQLDVFHWFLDRYPTSVRGTGAVRCYDDGREVPDTVHCDFSFGDGVGLAWSGTLGNSYRGRHETLVGSMAAIELAWTAGWMFKEADAPTQGWEVYANRESFHDDEGITLIADATKLAEQGKLKEGVGLPHPPLYYGLADFVRSAADGAPCACSADEGLRATLVGIAAHRAVTERGEVAIEL